jgi:hypothetical protein
MLLPSCRFLRLHFPFDCQVRTALVLSVSAPPAYQSLFVALFFFCFQEYSTEFSCRMNCAHYVLPSPYHTGVWSNRDSQWQLGNQCPHHLTHFSRLLIMHSPPTLVTTEYTNRSKMQGLRRIL